MGIDAAARETFQRELIVLLERFGATPGPALERASATCVEHMMSALVASAEDGKSLSALDVVRVRANKFAATQVPPSVFRDVRQLASLRAELRVLARALVGGERSLFGAG